MTNLIHHITEIDKHMTPARWVAAILGAAALGAIVLVILAATGVGGGFIHQPLPQTPQTLTDDQRNQQLYTQCLNAPSLNDPSCIAWQQATGN
jgi:hypothetical protein